MPSSADAPPHLPSFPTRRSSDLTQALEDAEYAIADFGVFGNIDIQPQLSKAGEAQRTEIPVVITVQPALLRTIKLGIGAEVGSRVRSEEHTSELQSPYDLVCRLLPTPHRTCPLSLHDALPI